MNNDELLVELRRCEIAPDAHTGAWRDSIDLLAALDAIGRSGGSAVVKVDGNRPGADVYTLVLSGGQLGEHFFRKDGADLSALIAEGLSFFVMHRKR